MNEDPDEVEAILRSLDPAASKLDFSEAMYLAGRASATTETCAGARRRVAWLWPCATVASVLAAVTFAVLWGTSGKPELVERIVYVEREQPSTAAAQPAHVASVAIEPSRPWEQYAQLREIILTQGLENLPEIQWRSVTNGESAMGDRLDDPVLKRFLGG